MPRKHKFSRIIRKYSCLRGKKEVFKRKVRQEQAYYFPRKREIKIRITMIVITAYTIYFRFFLPPLLYV